MNTQVMKILHLYSFHCNKKL